MPVFTNFNKAPAKELIVYLYGNGVGALTCNYSVAEILEAYDNGLSLIFRVNATVQFTFSDIKVTLLGKNPYQGLIQAFDAGSGGGGFGITIQNIGESDVFNLYSSGHLYGTSNTVTLAADGWIDGVYTLTIEDMGENDAVFFEPSTRADKTALEDADVFISANGQTVTFEAETTPKADIALNYFIARGR